MRVNNDGTASSRNARVATHFGLNGSARRADLDLLLTTLDGRVLKRVKLSNANHPFEVDSLWLKGNRRILAKVFGRRGNAVDYTLHVDRPESDDDPLNFTSARLTRQQAWYYFRVNSNALYDVMLTWRQNPTNADLVLTDTDNNVIAESRRTSGNVEKFRVRLDKDRRYYLKVFVLGGGRIDYNAELSEYDDGGGSSSGGSSSSGSSSGSSGGSSSGGSSSSGSSSSGSSSSGSSSSGSSSGGLPDLVFGKDTTPPAANWQKPRNQYALLRPSLWLAPKTPDICRRYTLQPQVPTAVVRPRTRTAHSFLPITGLRSIAFIT